MSEDEELERLAFLREKWERDEVSLKDYHEEMERDNEEARKNIQRAKIETEKVKSLRKNWKKERKK